MPSVSHRRAQDAVKPNAFDVTPGCDLKAAGNGCYIEFNWSHGGTPATSGNAGTLRKNWQHQVV